jgi:hypothetical protein
VAAEEDKLAIHTLVMAAYSILEDLSKGRRYYEEGIKTHLTKIGRKRFRATANFLKHADRDSDAVLKPDGIEDIEWRIGWCIILYHANLQARSMTTSPLTAERRGQRRS